MSKKADNSGCAIAVGVVVLFLFILGLGKCGSSQTGAPNLVTSNQTSDALSNSIATQDIPPIQPLDGKAVRTGISHSKIAISAEGLSGAMIYSQNCYDALAREFSWTKLDACGAFDMAVIRAMGDDDQSGLDKEATWFADETAAARYLSAVTGAGQTSDDADVRLSGLQAKVAKAPRAKPTPAPPIEDDVSADDDALNDTVTPED